MTMDYLTDALKQIRTYYELPREWKIFNIEEEDDCPFWMRFSDDCVPEMEQIDIKAQGEILSSDNVKRVKIGVVQKDDYAVVRVISDSYGGSKTIVFAPDWDEFFEKNVKGKTIYEGVGAGLYTIAHSQNGSYLHRVNMGESEKPVLNDDIYNTLNREINGFVENESLYREMKIDYKRGILLCGPPGNGKTSFIKHVLHEQKDAISTICDAQQMRDITFCKEFLSRSNNDKMLKVIVLEDIDGVQDYQRSDILNFLDGIYKMDKVIFIATTNFPEKLDIAIRDRPSRFDCVMQIGVPDEQSRRELLLRFFPDIEMWSEWNLDECVKTTEGFSGAYFKEIYVLSRLNKQTVREAIDMLKSRFSFFKKDE